VAQRRVRAHSVNLRGKKTGASARRGGFLGTKASASARKAPLRGTKAAASARRVNTRGLGRVPPVAGSTTSNPRDVEVPLVVLRKVWVSAARAR
jgi:hypothetical protein